MSEADQRFIREEINWLNGEIQGFERQIEHSSNRIVELQARCEHDRHYRAGGSCHICDAENLEPATESGADDE